jgi:hypothetical protein
VLFVDVLPHAVARTSVWGNETEVCALTQRADQCARSGIKGSDEEQSDVTARLSAWCKRVGARLDGQHRELTVSISIGRVAIATAQAMHQ